jgi:hypothetical protein
MTPWYRAINFVLVACLALVLVFAQSSFAQDVPAHIVSPADIQRDLMNASAVRQKNLAQLEHFFSSEQAQKALASTHIDYNQVMAASRMLSDEDLARIAARTEQAQKDFAAGSLSHIELLFLVGAIIVIIIIIAVEA